MAAEDEGDGPVAALLRDGLDAEAAAPPSVMSAVNTSWDASAERAALRDNLNAYLTREAAAYSGKENQWKSTQGEKSELAATQEELVDPDATLGSAILLDFLGVPFRTSTLLVVVHDPDPLLVHLMTAGPRIVEQPRRSVA